MDIGVIVFTAVAVISGGFLVLVCWLDQWRISKMASSTKLSNKQAEQGDLESQLPSLPTVFCVECGSPLSRQGGIIFYSTSYSRKDGSKMWNVKCVLGCGMRGHPKLDLYLANHDVGNFRALVWYEESPRISYID